MTSPHSAKRFSTSWAPLISAPLVRRSVISSPPPLKISSNSSSWMTIFVVAVGRAVAPPRKKIFSTESSGFSSLMLACRSAMKSESPVIESVDGPPLRRVIRTPFSGCRGGYISFNRVRASRSTSWLVAHNSARSAHASRLDFVRETYFSMIFNVAKQCLVARHERCRRVKEVGPK